MNKKANINMDVLKAELRQIKRTLACSDKKIRELTTRLERETDERKHLSEQNKILSAEIKRMQPRHLRKKRELENLKDVNKKLPLAKTKLTTAEATHAQNGCTVQPQCQRMQPRHLGKKTENLKDVNEQLPLANTKLTSAEATHAQNGCTIQPQCQKRQLESTEDKIQTLERLIESYKAMLQEKTEQLAECQKVVDNHSLEFERFMKVSEEDKAKIIHNIAVGIEKKLQTQKEVNIKQRAEMIIMEKKYQDFHKQFEEKGTEMYMLRQEKLQLLGLTQSLQREIEDLKCEHENICQEKDGTILGLKQKNQELSGLKLILESQLSKLKENFEPQQEELTEKRQMIGQLQDKLRQMGSNYNKLMLTVSDLRLRLKVEGNDLHKEKQKMKNLETHVQRLKSELHNCIDIIQEPKKLKETVQMIHARYVSQSERLEMNSSDKELHREVYRQRDCLNRTINSLKLRLAKSNEEHQKVYARISKDNVSLISEINRLKMEFHLVKTEVKDSNAQRAPIKRPNNLTPQLRGRTQKGACL